MSHNELLQKSLLFVQTENLMDILMTLNDEYKEETGLKPASSSPPPYSIRVDTVLDAAHNYVMKVWSPEVCKASTSP